MGIPEFVATSAAISLVIIPPVARDSELCPANFRISGVICSTTLIISALSSTFGLAEYNPSISERRTNKSASRILATKAERVSLSPNSISSTATVSFSLITGIAPYCSKDCNALREFKYLFLLLKSSRVSSTCATTNPYSVNSFSYI